MRIKVCGITQRQQAETLGEMGITFCGFIFYKKSPRYVLSSIHKEEIKKITNINKVGVFVNAPAEDVLQIVDDCRLQAVQLHGDETPHYCGMISNYISVIKAFRIGGALPVETYINDYFDVADFYLFDTSGNDYGGTGKKFDWNLLNNISINKPYFLSGGIAPGDEEIIKQFQQQPAAKNLFALDINSKFEVSPGIKDIEKISAFVNVLKE